MIAIVGIGGGCGPRPGVLASGRKRGPADAALQGVHVKVIVEAAPILRQKLPTGNAW